MILLKVDVCIVGGERWNNHRLEGLVLPSLGLYDGTITVSRGWFFHRWACTMEQSPSRGAGSSIVGLVRWNNHRLKGLVLPSLGLFDGTIAFSRGGFFYRWACSMEQSPSQNMDSYIVNPLRCMNHLLKIGTDTEKWLGEKIPQAPKPFARTIQLKTILQFPIFI